MLDLAKDVGRVRLRMRVRARTSARDVRARVRSKCKLSEYAGAGVHRRIRGRARTCAQGVSTQAC